MKKLFYIGLLGIILFEILNVYFIMPLPGSQRMNSIEVAYFLHSWRWVFRAVFAAMVLAGSVYAFRVKKKWIPVAVLLPVLVIVYVFNIKMTADNMFLQPEHVVLKSRAENTVPGERLVIGAVYKGDARAYPIAFLEYHHQVRDSIGGKPVMVTYCNVCRTGRVFEPVVNGKYENFRLVGMDHFNAMFEDETTGSWWRQANGQAIIGKLRGTALPEMESRQMTVDKWFALYPDAKVMQADKAFTAVYDSLATFETGTSESKLVGTDSLSWKEKSWVVGISIGASSKAYDWNDLENEQVINDAVGQTPIVLALASDGQSFAAFKRPSNKNFSINDEDILLCDSLAYDFSGRAMASSLKNLEQIKAYQEFWHSWRTFYPETQKYGTEEPDTDR